MTETIEGSFNTRVSTRATFNQEPGADVEDDGIQVSGRKNYVPDDKIGSRYSESCTGTCTAFVQSRRRSLEGAQEIGWTYVLIPSLLVYPEAISRLQAFHVAGPDGRANWFSNRRIVTGVHNKQYSIH